MIKLKCAVFGALLALCEARSAPFYRQSVLSTVPSVEVNKRPTWNVVPRGGSTVSPATDDVVKDSPAGDASPAISIPNMVVDAANGLTGYIKGTKADTLFLLATSAFIPGLCKLVGMSPILGFLASGVLLGPNGKNLIADVHTTETLADLGVVFFLFEMGIHLNFDTLMSMRRDVFGLGLSQFVFTALAVAAVASLCGQSAAAMVVLGGGLALSSSAFVLQLLKDKDELSTDFGKSSFGVLLLQDLAVVPLLVVTPILAGGGDGLASALTSALVKAVMALGTIAVAGKFLLNPAFDLVSGAQSQEAFVGLILFTVLGMSFLTEGLGLSNTLGAFLAGVLLADTQYRHQVEKEISPFRGILVGLFFFTVGFEIDLNLIASKIGLVMSIVLGTMAAKAAIAAAVCMVFGKGLSISQRCGFILSQGGEFAFVAFRLAREFGILDKDTTKLMLTCVSLTMALTPLVNALGAQIAQNLEEGETKKVK
uniref:Cation/H+ exchanger transmembrane domain-containing protein n=1 Tax=Odontella aurita TaxID=265563 RepID=A0A7S4JK13_9STRA|mmetsp:Transcript_47734/g.144333  ORF Transcript_47734/g.144333 Transcript_47734/m.144333 type:complete len:482 (+) Transcript_47734:86-1531(+)|eukprot:CAMPEP_0113551212 /NCGR_PEP_ID=MMETSP0015_2-20120614/14406_1 /TAXON_ID=2838 /ORGANISM="Odontella" /LENGTH=481 /DNA_ID=CAMNT_0000452093 /DNA_START=73 /DNA_END=1518 /DNA_ORIENTATION=+ /assembly_acc=CAM_ASM_000160